MPTYQYACTECGDRTEVVQRFTDDPLTVCAACDGKLRKVFSPVGIVFKGSGFYRTDSRNGSTSAETAKPGEKTSGKSANGSSESTAASANGSGGEGGSGSGSSGSGSSEKVGASSGSASPAKSSAKSAKSAGSKVA